MLNKIIVGLIISILLVFGYGVFSVIKNAHGLNEKIEKEQIETFKSIDSMSKM